MPRPRAQLAAKLCLVPAMSGQLYSQLMRPGCSHRLVAVAEAPWRCNPRLDNNVQTTGAVVRSLFTQPPSRTDLRAAATGGQLAAKSVKIYRTPDESFSLQFTYCSKPANPFAPRPPAANIAVLITCIKVLCL